MKYLISIVFCSITVMTVYGQCESASNFSISMHSGSENPYFGPYCNHAQDISNVKVNESVYFRLDEIVATSPVSIEWKDNGVIFYDDLVPNVDNGSDYYYHTFTGTGTRTISCTYTFDGTCSITKSFQVNVSARDCPFLTVDVTSVNQCMFPTGSLDITVQNDGTFGSGYTIDNVTWIITDHTGNVSNYVTNGPTLTFEPPSPGEYSGTAQASVTLNSGQTCIVPINGSGCDFEIGAFNYSDPFFVTSGLQEAGETIDVIFKGNNSYPEQETSHNYTLYIDGTQVFSGTLYYDQVIHSFTASLGSTEVKLVGAQPDIGCSDEYIDTLIIAPSSNPDEECFSCNSFKPIANERYWLSAWVKEDHASQVKTYQTAHVSLTFNGTSTTTVDFYPEGDIVEGWQRIVGSFTIPSGTADMDIELKNPSGTLSAYFDDVRIHPFNASMKSYVYDPETLWLTAELDDNNYATFYEYDLEGQLIRIKKETARGIMTIQESRSSNPKEE